MEDNREQDDKKVLRAQDIIPSSEPKSNGGDDTAVFHYKNNGTVVPQFDLATEIMAQQRKITSARRKKPENKNQPEEIKPQIQYTPMPDTFSLQVPAYEAIITEIVKRDIQRMLAAQNRQ